MSIQTDRIKEEFAKRLHLAMDIKGYPLRGRARILSQEFKISDKGAGKWLNGEAIPETSKIPLLAKFLDVNSEWLLMGENSNPSAMENENNFKTKDQSLNDAIEVKNPQVKNITNSLIALDAQDKLSQELIDALNSIISLIKNSKI